MQACLRVMHVYAHAGACMHMPVVPLAFSSAWHYPQASNAAAPSGSKRNTHKGWGKGKGTPSRYQQATTTTWKSVPAACCPQQQSLPTPPLSREHSLKRGGSHQVHCAAEALRPQPAVCGYDALQRVREEEEAIMARATSCMSQFRLWADAVEAEELQLLLDKEAAIMAEAVGLLERFRSWADAMDFEDLLREEEAIMANASSWANQFASWADAVEAEEGASRRKSRSSRRGRGW